MNTLIASKQSRRRFLKINKIIGGNQPGYLYGNVKIQKPRYPLRPITSQILSCIYQLSKWLNDIITLYLPTNYRIKSTHEFLQITKRTFLEFLGKFCSKTSYSAGNLTFSADVDFIAKDGRIMSYIGC